MLNLFRLPETGAIASVETKICPATTLSLIVEVETDLSTTAITVETTMVSIDLMT